MNMSADNGDFNDDCCYMNGSTESVINNKIILIIQRKDTKILPTDI